MVDMKAYHRLTLTCILCSGEASDIASVTSSYSSNAPLPYAEMEEAINVKEGFADTMYFL